MAVVSVAPVVVGVVASAVVVVVGEMLGFVAVVALLASLPFFCFCLCVGFFLFLLLLFLALLSSVVAVAVLYVLLVLELLVGRCVASCQLPVARVLSTSVAGCMAGRLHVVCLPEVCPGILGHTHTYIHTCVHINILIEKWTLGIGAWNETETESSYLALSPCSCSLLLSG